MFNLTPVLFDNTEGGLYEKSCDLSTGNNQYVLHIYVYREGAQSSFIAPSQYNIFQLQSDLFKFAYNALVNYPYGPVPCHKQAVENCAVCEAF